MKTILYLLIVVFVLGIVATAIPNKALSSKTITIEAFDKNVSQHELLQSARVITERLKSFSSEKFDLKVKSEKNQMELTFSDKWDLNTAVFLLMQKGRLEFYETYNKNELLELLNGANQLFGLLKPVPSDFQVGTISQKEFEKVNSYLNTVDLNRNCQFVWGVSGKSEFSLYALKSGFESRALLANADIRNVGFDKNELSESYEISLQFKDSSIEKWAEATKRNINRAITIVFDNTVICSPIIKSPINGGNCIISGNLTKNEAKSFVSIVKNGELPVQFKIVK